MKKLFILFFGALLFVSCATMIKPGDIAGVGAQGNQIGLVVLKDKTPDRILIYDAQVGPNQDVIYLHYVGYQTKDGVIHKVGS